MENDNVTLTTALQQMQQQQFQPNTTNMTFNIPLNPISEDCELNTVNTDTFTVLTNTMKSYANNSIAQSITSNATVDTKAINIINNMTSDRQQAVENLINEREKLVIDNEQLTKKNVALKSRISNLEGDVTKGKESMKVLINKTDSDDQLIELLRQEVARLKDHIKQLTEQSKQKKIEQDQFVSSRNQQVSNKNGAAAQKSRLVMDADALETELSRVKRLLEQQVL